VSAYDAFYKHLTSRISLSDVSASFVMEEIKETTALPL
jgi:Lrp/AsnC family transcriptional regulator